MVFSLDRLFQETLCHTKYGGLEDFSTGLAGPAQISGPLYQASLLSTNLHRQVVKFKIKFYGPTVKGTEDLILDDMGH